MGALLKTILIETDSQLVAETKLRVEGVRNLDLLGCLEHDCGGETICLSKWLRGESMFSSPSFLLCFKLRVARLASACENEQATTLMRWN